MCLALKNTNQCYSRRFVLCVGDEKTRAPAKANPNGILTQHTTCVHTEQSLQLDSMNLPVCVEHTGLGDAPYHGRLIEYAIRLLSQCKPSFVRSCESKLSHDAHS